MSDPHGTQITELEIREAELQMTGRRPSDAAGFIGFVPATPSVPLPPSPPSSPPRDAS